MTEPPTLSPTAAAAVDAKPLSPPVRWLLIALAVLSLVLGVIGIFVPLLPTVPFILLSAWAASRSSPRLLAWLEGHAAFGPMLREWRLGGVVRRQAKWAATLTMAASAVFLVWRMPKLWMALVVIALMACVLVSLWRRPETLPTASPSPV